MIEATITFGVIISIGLIMMITACPRWLRTFVLRHPVLVDITVFSLTLWIHWGTMTGLMAATFATLICSVSLRVARRWYGVRS